MATGMLSMALVAAIGAGPGSPSGYGAGRGATPVTYGAPVESSSNYDGGSYDGGSYGGPSYAGPSGGGYPEQLPAYGAYPGNDDLWPYDSQLPWMHGYFQEMPAYGGFVYFRPYNYKHVLSQSQVAGGWGMQPTMPYSQQFWHRFQQQAAMSPQLSEYRQAPAPRFTTARPRRDYLPASYLAPQHSRDTLIQAGE